MIASVDAPVGDLERTVPDLREALRKSETQRDAALAREAALAEVVAAINRSPGDPGPVFQTILRKAHSLCGVTIGSLGTYDGTYVHIIAAHGYPPDSHVRARSGVSADRCKHPAADCWRTPGPLRRRDCDARGVGEQFPRCR